MTRRRQTYEERIGNVFRQMAPGTLGGRARSAMPISPPLGALRTPRPRGEGGGKEYATVYVAASDSHQDAKDTADYVCDGVADDVQIQAAVSDCLTLGGGRVILLEGTYVLDTNVDVGADVKLQGQGWSTILTPASNGIAVALRLTAANGQISSLAIVSSVGTQFVDAIQATSTASYGTIEAVRIDLTSGDGIDLQNLSGYGFTVRGCYLTDTGAIGINDVTQSVVIDGNVLDNCGTVGWESITSWGRAAIVNNVIVDAPTDAIVMETTQSAVVSGNVIINPVLRGIEILNFGGDPIIVTGNIIRSPGSYGIDANATRSLITGNVIIEGSLDGIRLARVDISVVGNLIYACGQAAHNTYSGIITTNAADNCQIQGNTVRHGGGAVQLRHGISIVAGSNDNFITNNDLKNSGATASFSDAGTGTITAAGNRL